VSARAGRHVERFPPRLRAGTRAWRYARDWVGVCPRRDAGEVLLEALYEHHRFFWCLGGRGDLVK
jgi:hypothetical protein